MSADTDAPWTPHVEPRDPLYLLFFLFFLFSLLFFFRGRAAGKCCVTASALLGCLLLLCSAEVLAPASKNISVTAGQSVSLECRAHVSKDDVIAVLQWKKAELKSDGYVFFFRDDHFNGAYQDRRFRGRVRLRDPDMSNGDVSVVLGNVTANDSGTYECRVWAEPGGRRRVRRFEPEPASVVRLTVTEPGHTDGGTKDGGTKDGATKDGATKDGGTKDGGNKDKLVSLVVGLGAFAVVVVGVVVFMIYKQRNRHQPVAQGGTYEF